MERHSHKPDFGAMVDFNKMSLVSPTQVAFKTTDNFELNGKKTKQDLHSTGIHLCFDTIRSVPRTNIFLAQP